VGVNSVHINNLTGFEGRRAEKKKRKGRMETKKKKGRDWMGEKTLKLNSWLRPSFLLLPIPQ